MSYIHRCKYCNNVIKTDGYENINCPRCSGLRYFADRSFKPVPNPRMENKEVKGKYSEKHKCSEECTHAIGNICTCSCGGANHGSAYVQHLTQEEIRV